MVFTVDTVNVSTDCNFLVGRNVFQMCKQLMENYPFYSDQKCKVVSI